ncbi:MAG: fibronectin type III domain-containing protein [Solirubrobacterales bacterium]
MHLTKEYRRLSGLLCLCFLCLLFGLSAASQALAAEEVPPYEFDAELSLTGNCTTSKADPVEDPGCPEKIPPKPFAKPMAIAIDSFGDEYVASFGSGEGAEGRIDVFSPEGVFITEITGSLGPKSLAVDAEGNVYAFEVNAASVTTEIVRYIPTVYKPAEGKIEYGERHVVTTFNSPSVGGVAVDTSDGHLFVAHAIQIDEYSSAGEGNKLLSTITNEKLYFTNFVTVDAQRRRLYASSCPGEDITKCWVLVFDADTHELLAEVEGPNPPAEKFLSGKGWMSIAVDEETGDFFVGDLELTKNVYQFNEDYEHISTLAIDPALFEGGEPMQIAVSNADGVANCQGVRNKHCLYVPSLRSRALAFHPAVEKPPVIASFSAVGIGEIEAELLATIKPQGGVTEYRLEYLSQQEFEEAGNSFSGAKVVGEGTILPTEQEAEVSAPISGLQPETTYRFRVFAENGAGSGEAEGIFATYNDAGVGGGCVNEALRAAHSTLLPDCRAYELVTPPDTNGRPPQGLGAVGDQFTTLEASPQGEAVSFITEGGIIPGLGGTGSFNGDPYRSTRTASGWSTVSTGPNGAETASVNAGSTSPDQGYSFWTATREGSAVVEGLDTHYVRYPDGHSALVGRGSEGTDPRAFGKLIAEGGAHIVFQTKPENGKQPIQLEPKAAPTGTQAVYDRTPDEVTHVVSLRPDGEPFKAGEDANYLGASADGKGIAFSIKGTLYLRVDDAQTFKVAEGVTFAGVSEEGKRVFYVEGGNLFAFDTETESAIPFTDTGNAVPVNISPGGTRAYFVSTTPILTAGPNPNGAFPKNKQQNLYLSEEGEIRFVGTLTETDVKGEFSKIAGTFVEGLGLWTQAFEEVGTPRAKDPSRITPEGTVLLFTSRAKLGGYDPEGVREIYRYDSAEERLQCISCIPTKTPVGEGASLESYIGAPGVSESLMFPTVLIPNLVPAGNRAFFQSTEALVSRDNDGVQDVYEWEEQGVGSCTRAGGCIYLVSSGQSEKPNYLYGVSSSGDDVFFFTNDVLFGGDNDTRSIYDARVNGGFPEPNPLPCLETDKCRGTASPPPVFPAPTSEGLGRVEEAPTLKCSKGKRKVIRNGKEVCVKKKKHHHRKANTKRKGAGK